MIFIISIVKAVIAWLIVTYIGTNLVGMVGRGFWEKPLDPSDHADFLKKEIKKQNTASKLITIISILAAIVICFYIYKWWGILFLIAIILIMVSRIPDLYWEIRILPKELGIPYPVPKPIIRQAIKSKHNRPIWDTALAYLVWIALVVLFFAFFSHS